MPKRRKLFVLQEVISPDILQLVNKDEITPPTVGIPTVEWLRHYTRPHIMGQSASTVHRFSPKDILEWGLRDGDLVWIDSDFNICEVDGISDPWLAKNRPHIVGPGAIYPAYPNRRLRVEKYNNPILVGFSWLAPVGKGHELFIGAPPHAGKSWVVRAFWEACLRLTLEDDNMYVIALHVGERAVDGTELLQVMKNTPYKKGRVEFYQTPDSDPDWAHFYVTEYVVNRARALTATGFDVVLIVDSMSRVLMSHSRSSAIPKSPEAGMISGGISTDSIGALRKLLTGVGDFSDGSKERSLTLVCTMLSPSGGYRSSESILFEETAISSSSSIWGLVGVQILAFTRYDVVNSKSREFKRITTEEEQKWMASLDTSMWAAADKAEENQPRGKRVDRSIIACQHLQNQLEKHMRRIAYEKEHAAVAVS